MFGNTNTDTNKNYPPRCCLLAVEARLAHASNRSGRTIAPLGPPRLSTASGGAIQLANPARLVKPSRPPTTALWEKADPTCIISRKCRPSRGLRAIDRPRGVTIFPES